MILKPKYEGKASVKKMIAITSYRGQIKRYKTEER